MPEIGSAVICKAGRPKGYCVVIKIEGGYCYIADGKLRTADNPKKKNPKHLEATGFVIKEVAERLNKGMKVGRDTLKRALKPYQN